MNSRSWKMCVEGKMWEDKVPTGASTHSPKLVPFNVPSSQPTGKHGSCSSKYPPGFRLSKIFWQMARLSLKHVTMARAWMKSNGSWKVHSSSASSTWNSQLGGLLVEVSRQYRRKSSWEGLTSLAG
jgi:hypothetical protein